MKVISVEYIKFVMRRVLDDYQDRNPLTTGASVRQFERACKLLEALVEAIEGGHYDEEFSMESTEEQ